MFQVTIWFDDGWKAYLEKIAGHHVEAAFWLGLGRTYIGKCNGHDLVFAWRIIYELMHPWIECVLIFHDAFVQYEIRGDQHEQWKFISLTVVTSISKLIG